MSRAVRGVLRDATGPMTVAAIATAVIAQRGLQDADQEVVRKLVGSALRNFKRRGQATSRHGRGLALEWSLTEPNGLDSQ